MLAKIFPKRYSWKIFGPSNPFPFPFSIQRSLGRDSLAQAIYTTSFFVSSLSDAGHMEMLQLLRYADAAASSVIGGFRAFRGKGSRGAGCELVLPQGVEGFGWDVPRVFPLKSDLNRPPFVQGASRQTFPSVWSEPGGATGGAPRCL